MFASSNILVLLRVSSFATTSATDIVIRGFLKSSRHVSLSGIWTWFFQKVENVAGGYL